MKKLFTLFLCLTISAKLLAIGGEWMYQISCMYEGEERIIYVSAYDYNTIPTDFENDKAAFPAHFKEIYGKEKMLTVFNRLKDQEKFAETAGFPMHNYLIDRSSSEELVFKKIKNVRLMKVWSRIAYGITVLTRLNEDDLEWIGNCKERSNFGFDDVGCRIELYSKEPLDQNDPDIKAIYNVLSNEGDYVTKEQIEMIRPHVINLKHKQIAVVQLCGC